MHVSPAKQLCVITKDSVTTGTDRQGRKHIEQSDPYEPLCFAVDTKTINFKEKPVAR